MKFKKPVKKSGVEARTHIYQTHTHTSLLVAKLLQSTRQLDPHQRDRVFQLQPTEARDRTNKDLNHNTAERQNNCFENPRKAKISKINKQKADLQHKQDKPSHSKWTDFYATDFLNFSGTNTRTSLTHLWEGDTLFEYSQQIFLIKHTGWFCLLVLNT